MTTTPATLPSPFRRLNLAQACGAMNDNDLRGVEEAALAGSVC